MSDQPSVDRQSIYVGADRWMQLRTLGLSHNTSASAQIVALIELYLDDMSDRQRAAILARAMEITRGRRGRG